MKPFCVLNYPCVDVTDIVFCYNSNILLLNSVTDAPSTEKIWTEDG